MANNNLYEFKYKSWRDVPISEYYKIVDIVNDESLPTDEKSMSLLAFCLDVDEDVVYDMNLLTVKNLLSQILWIFNFDFNKKFRNNKISLNNNIYEINSDLTKFSVSQYMDFTMYWQKNDLRKYYGNILACFIVPKGKKYAEEYNTQELADEIYNSLDIVSANEIVFFFLKKSVNLIEAILIYSQYLTKKTMKKEKDQEKLAKLQNILKMYQTLLTALSGYILSTAYRR